MPQLLPGQVPFSIILAQIALAKVYFFFSFVARDEGRLCPSLEPFCLLPAYS